MYLQILHTKHKFVLFVLTFNENLPKNDFMNMRKFILCTLKLNNYFSEKGQIVYKSCHG